MKNNIKYIIAVALLGATSTQAMAQNLNTGYFNDGYLYRHDLNPAFANEQDYVAFPVLGNLGISVNSNLRVDDVLYNVNGKTALFLHPSVDTDEFLSKIKDRHKISENLRLQILGFGFKSFGGYNTVELNARENLGLSLPGSLFRLAKQGIANETYDLSDLNVHADAYAELAFGHSRQINEQWRVGGKFKLLFGIANADLTVNNAQLALENDRWVGTTDAELQLSLSDVKYEMETKARGPEGSQTTHKYVSGIDDSKVGISGFGMAIDLGAQFKLDQNWTFSAALLDLGWIGWSKNYVAAANGEINTGAYVFDLDDDADHSFENETDRLTEGLSDLYELQDKGDQGGRSTGVGATLNLGAQYTPDFYDKLTFGLLNSTRIDGKYSWTEFRLSANVTPVKGISATTNLALGTYGASFGWLINFNPNGFNFFVGMDHTLGKLAKQGLPLSGRAHLNLGINFPFGGK